MKSSILLFQIPKPLSIKIIKNLLPLKIKIRQIRPEEYHLPVGALAGVSNTKPSESISHDQNLSDPMIVFSGLTNAQLDYALSAIRRSGAGFILYKAVLTMTNQNWNAFELLEELKKEHKKMNPS